MHNLISEDVLLELVPLHLKLDPFVIALSKAVAKEIRQAHQEAYELSDFLTFAATSEDLLDVIAFEKMVEYYFDLTTEEKRELISNARDLKKRKGTVFALEKALEILSFSGVVNEWFEYGGDPGHFNIAVDLSLRGTSIESLTLLDRVVDEYKRKSSWLDAILIYLTSNGELYYSGMTQLSEIIEVNAG